MIVCAKCTRPTTRVSSIHLRKTDTAHKMVCHPCHERLTAYRAKRKLKEENNK